MEEVKTDKVPESIDQSWRKMMHAKRAHFERCLNLRPTPCAENVYRAEIELISCQLRYEGVTSEAARVQCEGYFVKRHKAIMWLAGAEPRNPYFKHLSS